MVLTIAQKRAANRTLKALTNTQVEDLMILGPNVKRRLTNENITNAQRERILKLYKPFTRSNQKRIANYITRLNPQNFKNLRITKFGKNFTQDDINAMHVYANYISGKAKNVGYVQPGSFFKFTKNVPIMNKILWNYKISNDKKRLLREKINTMSWLNTATRIPRSVYRSTIARGKKEAKVYGKQKAIQYLPSVMKETLKTAVVLAASALVTKKAVNVGASVIRTGISAARGKQKLNSNVR